MKKLGTHFYNRHAVTVAKELLGKTLSFDGLKGIITETEAYRGLDDEASHAYRLTPRSTIMFGPPGYTYVYLIYGMYHCLNIVAEEDGQPAAVLIRGLQFTNILLDGPGKICRHLGITRQHQGIDLGTDPNFYVTEGMTRSYKATPRIGIKKSTDKLWRFILCE